MKESDKINPQLAALHGDYKYIKDSLESQQQKIERLEAFISYYTTCPCCEQDKECLEDCTFKDDSPNDYDIMQDARGAMR